MKKLALFIVFAAVLQSCSSSNSEPVSPDAVLLKRIIETTPQGTFTYTYTYDGYKMVESALSTNNFLRRVSYTYTGDLITKTEFFDTFNTLTGSAVYTYTIDNRLESFVTLNYVEATGTRVTYTDNPNGTISSVVYSGDLNTQDVVVSYNTITLNNGEVSSLVQNTGTVTKTTNFVYDAKNNPFKNVIGFAKLSYAVTGPLTNPINHNRIQWTTSDDGGPAYTTNLQYTYNSNGFPTSQKAGGNTDTILRYYY